jgi:hypothetical protein
MMLSVGQPVEWVTRETEVLGKNLSLCLFVHHKSYMTWPGLEFGPPRLEPSNQPPELRHGLNQIITHSMRSKMRYYMEIT